MPKPTPTYLPKWLPARPGNPPLAATEIQVWWIPPDVTVPGALTKSEIAEASLRPEGPVLEQWRRTRRGVRGILAGIKRVNPATLCIERSELGKPYLADSGLHFSVSHSGKHIVVAVGRQLVGVDVEIFGRERLSLEVADRYFPAAEARWLRSLPPEEMSDSFLRLWVSKESALKCLGTGLAGYLERTTCGRPAGGRISTVRVDGQKLGITEFELDGSGRGALAVEGAATETRFLRALFHAEADP